ncbi:hypothetical protein CR513_31170, partial [Mucuna pruriens]
MSANRITQQLRTISSLVCEAHMQRGLSSPLAHDKTTSLRFFKTTQPFVAQRSLVAVDETRRTKQAARAKNECHRILRYRGNASFSLQVTELAPYVSPLSVYELTLLENFLSCFTKMNTTQVTAFQPGICVKNASQLHRLHPKLCVLPKSFDPCSHYLPSLRARQSFGLKCRFVSQSRKPLHICLAGGKGMMGNDDENSPWKSIEKAIEKFKGQSIENVLRRQIEKGEYYDSGGGGANPPGGGGSSGSGGNDPDGFGESEDESFAGMWEENLQVILATLGFIFLYIYIITGEELTKLARDYIKYLFGGSQTVRLKNAMYQLGLLYQSIKPVKVEEEDEYWLEKAILNTPTWWHDPADYREALRNYLQSDSKEAIAARNYLGLNSDEEVRYCLESDDDEDGNEDEGEDDDENENENEDENEDEDIPSGYLSSFGITLEIEELNYLFVD